MPISSRFSAATDRLRSRIDAWRYARDRNALRFTAQTIKELPAQPPDDRRRLVLFAHYDPLDEVDEYVRFYLEELHRRGSTIVFVSGSARLKKESAAQIAPLCAGIYTRRTLSLDFGSWHLGWEHLRWRGWSLEAFDQLLLANDSVYGPLFDFDEMLSTLTKADLCGVTESMEYVSHVQSYFLLWNLNARTRAYLNAFWKDFLYVVDKDELIQRYEIGISAEARRLGLTQQAYIPNSAVSAVLDRKLPENANEERLPANNTLEHWQMLLEELRSPFLKTVIVRRSPDVPHILSVLRRSTVYNASLVEGNLRRLGIAFGPRPSANERRGTD